MGRTPDGKQLRPESTKFTAEPQWSEKKARKEAEKFAADFERGLQMGIVSNCNQTFQEYATYVFDLKEKNGIKHKTVFSYRKTCELHVFPMIGNVRIKDIKTGRLNAFYLEMMKSGSRLAPEMAAAKTDIAKVMKSKGINKTILSKEAKIQFQTVTKIINGESVKKEKGEAVAEVLGVRYSDIFRTVKDISPLSPKSVRRCHAIISTVLEQAKKEGLIPLNPAANCTLPRTEQDAVNYFKEDEIAEIVSALSSEPIRERTLITMFLYSGARKGEILGLKWPCVDFESRQIHICNNLLYSPDIGVYEDTPKSKTSNRLIAMPDEVMTLLSEYREWQQNEIDRLDGYFEDRGFVFTQPNGNPIHPDSVSSILESFSKRHNLPHINAHAFRHTMASMLYFNNVDCVSISKRLGHAQVSTTANIYSHIMAKSDRNCADVLANAYTAKGAE